VIKEIRDWMDEIEGSERGKTTTVGCNLEMLFGAYATLELESSLRLYVATIQLSKVGYAWPQQIPLFT